MLHQNNRDILASFLLLPLCTEPLVVSLSPVDSHQAGVSLHTLVVGLVPGEALLAATGEPVAALPVGQPAAGAGACVQNQSRCWQ